MILAIEFKRNFLVHSKELGHSMCCGREMPHEREEYEEKWIPSLTKVEGNQSSTH